MSIALLIIDMSSNSPLVAQAQKPLAVLVNLIGLGEPTLALGPGQMLDLHATTWALKSARA